MSIKLRPASPPQPFSFAPTSPPSQHGASSSKTPTTGAGNATNPIEFILEKDQSMFGAYPLDTERGKGLLKCRKCAKIVAEAAAGEHVRICNHVLNGAPLTNKKTVKKSETLKRRASEVSEENESPNKKRQKLPVPDDLSQLPPLPSFKGMKKSEIKRIKKERERLEKKALKLQAKNEAQERKRMRASEPVDLDRQCGVINDKGLPCSRSLTCKTHTVGAKRAVEGRSRLYDSLYLEWQRANNPNFKEPQKAGRKEKPEAEKEKKKPGRKKWEFSMNGSGAENEGIGEGEEGQREFEEMLVFARMGGERCRSTIASFGSGWDTMPSGQVRAAKAPKKVASHITGNGGTSNGNGTGAGGSVNGNNSTNGQPPLQPAAIAPSGANPAVVATPINKGTIPYSLDGIFRTAMTAYHGVGDTLTKALATRVSDIQATIGNKSAPGGSRVPHSMMAGQRPIASDGPAPSRSSAMAL